LLNICFRIKANSINIIYSKQRIREDEKRMVSKKQVFAAVALIAIAMSTIAWAQMPGGVATGTIYKSKVTACSPPSFVGDIKHRGSNVSYCGLNITVYFTYTIVRVALVDLGGLTANMDYFSVSFVQNATGNSTVATLTMGIFQGEPNYKLVDEFVFNAKDINSSIKAGGTISFDIYVAWVTTGGQLTEGTVRYAVSAEVVGVYGDKLND